MTALAILLVAPMDTLPLGQILDWCPTLKAGHPLLIREIVYPTLDNKSNVLLKRFLGGLNLESPDQ